MRHRRWVSAMLAAVLAFSGPGALRGMADEMDIQDEVIPDEEVGDEGEPEPAAEDNAAVYDTEPAQAATELTGVEAADQDEADDVLLIEDDGMEVVSVTNGADIREVAAAESEADAAALKVRELLDGIPITLESADPERIGEHLKSLTAVESPTGSDGELEAASYIEETMRSYGYTISEQHFHEGFLNEDYVDVPGVNIIAERGANSEQRTGEIVLICAHYDSKTDPDPADPLANDKSGAAAALESARILSTLDTNVDLCYLFLSGEEDGYFGSLRIAEGLTDEIRQRIRCVLYVGPVGYVMQERSAAEGASEAATEADTDSGTEGQTQELPNGDPSQAAPEESEAGEAKNAGEVPPYLISVPSDESNDPADLLQALGLYRQAEQLLAGDALWQGNAAGYDAAAGTQENAGETAPSGGSGEAGDEAVTQEDWDSLTGAEAERNLELLRSLDNWTQVTGEIGYLKNFAEYNMTVAGVFQPVDRDMVEDVVVRPVREASETDAAQAWTEAPAESEAAPAIAGSLGAEQISSVLLAAGTDPAGNGEDGLLPEKVPVVNVQELCGAADYLASAVSLYMRSQTSVVLQ